MNQTKLSNRFLRFLYLSFKTDVYSVLIGFDAFQYIFQNRHLTPLPQYRLQIYTCYDRFVPRGDDHFALRRYTYLSVNLRKISSNKKKLWCKATPVMHRLSSLEYNILYCLQKMLRIFYLAGLLYHKCEKVKMLHISKYRQKICLVKFQCHTVQQINLSISLQTRKIGPSLARLRVHWPNIVPYMGILSGF